MDDNQLSVIDFSEEVGPSAIFVDNFYGRYRSGVSSFEDAAQGLVSGLLVKPPPQDVERLVVIVRPWDYIKAVMKDPTWRVLNRPVAGGLNFFLAIDGEQTLSVPRAQQLAELGLEENQVWEIAIDNIPKRMGRLKIEQMDRSAWTVTSPNDLGLGILAHDGFWGAPPIPLKGPPAVAAIQKNLLVVVDTADEETLGRIQMWLVGLRHDPDTMSTALLVRSGASWTEMKF